MTAVVEIRQRPWWHVSAAEAHIVTVTPQLAAEWLEGNPINRTVTSRHVEALMRNMRSGDFDLNGETIKIDWNGQLMDAQHRLLAVVRSGITIQSFLAIGLDPLYRRSIDLTRRRSMADGLAMAGYKNHSVIGALLRRIVAWEATGGRMVFTMDPTPPEMNAVFDEERDACLTAAALGQSMQHACHAYPSAIAFSYYLCEKIDPSLAQQFFSSLKTGWNLKPGDPVVALRNRLQQAGKLEAVPQLGYIFKAWNLTRDGRSVSKLSMPKDERPADVRRQRPLVTTWTPDNIGCPR